MIMKFRYKGFYIIKAQILWFILFLSGPSRFKDHLMSGSSNSDVGGEKESLGKLFFFTVLVSMAL